MKTIWAVINYKDNEGELVFKGSKISCKAFIHDNEFLYPICKIRLYQKNNVKFL